jgi:hypothetical protein
MGAPQPGAPRSMLWARSASAVTHAAHAAHAMQPTSRVLTVVPGGSTAPAATMASFSTCTRKDQHILYFSYIFSYIFFPYIFPPYIPIPGRVSTSYILPVTALKTGHSRCGVGGWGYNREV